MVIAGGAFLLLSWITHGGIGFGDVKLAAMIGAATGAISLIGVWSALLAGSLASLIWATGARRSGPIPFGPSLLVGAWIALLVSPWSWVPG